jgi:hypothetical protein
VVNLFLISYVIGKLVTEQLRRGKLIFLQKSVNFAAKSVYFVAAHAAQRQNQFDLWLNQFGLWLTQLDLRLIKLDLRLTQFDLWLIKLVLRLIKFVFWPKTMFLRPAKAGKRS